MHADVARVGYVFGTVAVDVESESGGTDLHRFLEDCLAPGVHTRPSGQSEYLVRVSRSRDRYAALRARVSNGEPAPCFVHDRTIVALPTRHHEGALIVDDDNHACVFCMKDRTVDVVGPPDAPRVPNGVMRVVREILTSGRLQRDPVVDLHAAAFEWRGHGVLLLGPKHSGKTTLLCHAALSGARLIANDRVLVDRAGDTVSICGAPTLVALRPNTVALFPQLAIGHASPAFRSAATLTLAELARRLGTESVSRAPLQRVLFVTLADDVEGVTIVPMCDRDASAASDQAVYGVDRAAGVRTIFEDLHGKTPRRAVPQVPWLPDGVRASRCLLGPRAYERDAVEWLQQVIGA